jgi:hypothetical protein
MPFNADDQFFESCQKTISPERLNKYHLPGMPQDNTMVMSNYAWNIALSESLYPSLHFLEIALRNSIHNAASAHYRADDWYDIANLLAHYQADDVLKAKSSLQRQRKDITPPNIVASLTFGFWTSLFNKNYDATFFSPLAKRMFPYAPNRLYRRKNFAVPLEEIRKLRNRTMHYEPIWHLRDLRDKHKKICEILGYINPEKLVVLRCIDRFPGLYTAGSNAFYTTFQADVSNIRNPTP